MKKIYFLLLILLASPLTINYTSASFSSTKSENLQVSSEKSINLLKKYIDNLKKELTEISEKYNIQNDSKIKEKISRLNNMLYSIERIKTGKVQDSKINGNINNIIVELKSLNLEIKNHIKIKISEKHKEVELLKNKYSGKINILTKKLEKIYIILTKKSYKNNFDRKNEYIRHLKKLNSEITELKKINSLKFNSKVEFGIYLKERITNIKEKIIELKKIIQYNKNR